MKFSLLVLALIVGQLCLADDTTTERAKNGTGPGRGRYSNNNYRHRDYKDNYSHEKHHYRAPVIDDYVCDLEATILVVSSKHHVKDEKSYGKGNNYSPAGYGNGGQQQYDQQQYGNGGQQQYDQQQYGGNQGGYGNGGQQYDQQQYGDNQGGYGGSSPSYGGQQEKDQAKSYATPEALRLKCSHIATHSEHDCQTCCKLSARRYHSVSKHEIFGFIVNADEIKYDDKGYVRSKRSAEYGNQPAAPAPAYGSAPAPSYDNQPAPDYSPQTPGYSSDSNYPAASYGGSSYGYDAPPKNARCVCCAPKRHEDNYHHKRRHHHKDRSDEY